MTNLYRENTVDNVRNTFITMLKDEKFVEGRGGKTIEILGASFVADEDAIFGTVNKDYVDAEINWYESTSSNINDIYGPDKEPPQAWKMTANKHGEINSNYGLLIFSEKYGNQYLNVLNELIRNPDSRRATMVYNRPSIWQEYNEQGKNDFICTNAANYYVRDNKLHVNLSMRSNDAIFGYKNDRFWALYVLKLLVNDLQKSSIVFDELEIGNIYWNAGSLHVYERHFHLVK